MSTKKMSARLRTEEFEFTDHAHRLLHQSAFQTPTTQKIMSKSQPHQSTPATSIWRRALLVAVLAVLVWLAFYLRPGARAQPNVIYASRCVLVSPSVHMLINASTGTLKSSSTDLQRAL